VVDYKISYKLTPSLKSSISLSFQKLKNLTDLLLGILIKFISIHNYKFINEFLKPVKFMVSLKKFQKGKLNILVFKNFFTMYFFTEIFSKMIFLVLKSISLFSLVEVFLDQTHRDVKVNSKRLINEHPL